MTTRRRFVAAVQISLDGFMQAVDGDVGWIDSWNDALQLVPDADAAVIGGGTYPGYEQLWTSIAHDPLSATAMLGRDATDGEIEYAQWTQRTPHYVLSRNVAAARWPHTRLVRDVGELRSLREQPGGAVYVVGGAGLVASLFNAAVVDELALIVHPIILGGGKSLFAGVSGRPPLELVRSDAGRAGRAMLTYRVSRRDAATS